jgi:hypothetical protein
LRLIEGLDSKIEAIGESSLRFEETVRSIAGEARYELEHGGASPPRAPEKVALSTPP